MRGVLVLLIFGLVGLIAILALGLLTAPRPAAAQPVGKVYRIGILNSGSAASGAASGNVEAFRQGLRELGYVEGQNISLAWRYAEDQVEHLPTFAAELVGLPVDVLVAAGGTPVALAAQRATTTVPIVMTNVGDPVATGLIASLARPGGNITGLSSMSPDITGKRLELLKEVVPALARVAVLWNPANPSAALQLQELQAAARALQLQVQALEVRSPEAFAPAFSAARGAGAVIVLGDPGFTRHRIQITALAQRSRLPGMYVFRQFVEAGGLMSYGVSLSDLWRRAAIYVDKILQGVKPADLPVEQPTKFELVLNLQTAQALGLTIPSTLLFLADEVIR
jgi:putative tryptophan/tyrosine transport system substrate-binding protein